MAKKRYYDSVFVNVAVISFLTMSIQPSSANPVANQQEALNTIADFADRICERIPLVGGEKGMELSGGAKAELNGVLSRLVNLGIEGAVRYKDTSYQGLLQEDLVDALNDSRACKERIWNDFKGKIIDPDHHREIDNSRWCTEYDLAFVEEQLEQAKADSGASESVHRLVKLAAIQGTFARWVAECGRDYGSYELNTGNLQIKAKSYASYLDSQGKRCRKVALNTKTEGRWLKGTESIFCLEGGEWKHQQ